MYQNPLFAVGGDGYFEVGEGKQPIVTRLGYVGVETPFGTFTWGKQWSVYYVVAGMTDSFWTFGSEASGAFAVGDGGISGAGRAEQATNWRHRIGPVELGLQAQQRRISAGDRKWADTWGAMATVEAAKGLRLGAAWNEVRDGVPSPGLNEPMEGDRAAVFGVTWSKGPFDAALTFSPAWDHNQDDTGASLDTYGWELFTQYGLGKRWNVLGGFNFLYPRGDDASSRSRILDGIFGVSYRFGQELLLTTEVRIDGSRKSDGSDLRKSAVAFGMNYGW